MVVIMDNYTKISRDIPTSRRSSPHMAGVFVDRWFVPLVILEFVLADNGLQMVCRFFAMVCADLGVRHLTTTACYWQINSQAERFNHTIMTSLRHYVACDQQNWAIFVQTLTYAYNTQVHRSTNTSPYSLVLSRTHTGLSLLRPSPRALITGNTALIRS